MPQEVRQDRISSLAEVLKSRQLNSGGWGYFGSAQESIEATCLAALALGPETEANRSPAISFLLKSQLDDGSWPVFRGDSEGSWTTALAVCALNSVNDPSAAGERGQSWLLSTKGREGHWLWRWKFKAVDRKVRFNPEKYGWPWGPGAASWVIPTAFSLIALKRFTACTRPELSDNRIRIGVEMLLDRACIGGGWNAGNSVVYGQPLAPHVEPTAIALLALQDERRGALIESSLKLLRARAAEVQSVSSLGWAILTLFLYGESIRELKQRLAALVGDGAQIRNNATLAVAALALQCGETIHPFALAR